MIPRATIALLLLLRAAVAPGQTRPSELRTYDTRYYVIHTDLGRDAAREAELRLTHMAEEYRRRTRDFSGDVRKKLPFYLFRNEADYRAAGGAPNTAGEYDPNAQRLMTFAGGEAPNLATWYTVQHEGFHQFADQAIGGRLPIWANEGLAEYFGEALFTGDSFVPGVIPQWRLDRVRETIRSNGFAPLREVVSLPHGEWNRRISTTNYDHVWSFVHFLVHGDDGARQEPFARFLKDASGGQDVEASFARHLGQIEGLEVRWRGYWAEMGDDPTADVIVEATLRTLTSFLARATARRQRFDSFEIFLAAAERGELKSTESDWLPPSLLRVAASRVEQIRKAGGRFALVADAPRPPRITFTDADGRRMVGRFTLAGARVQDVTVDRPTRRRGGR